MKPATRTFLTELANLLEKHDTWIEATYRYIPFDRDGGYTIEIHGRELIDIDTEDLDASTIRDLLEK